MQPHITASTLHNTIQVLVAAATFSRMANAVKNGAKLITECRWEFVDDETIRVYSDSGEVYLTSLSDCVNEGTDKTCPAFAAAMPCKHRAALFILRKLTEEDEDGEHRCGGGCGRRFHIEKLWPVEMSDLRAGETVPSGQCPVCGFYCYPYTALAAAA